MAVFTGTTGACYKGGVVYGTPLGYLLWGLDEFTDTDGVGINQHTPTSGWTFWRQGTPVEPFTPCTQIVGNKARAVTGVWGGEEHVLANPALVDDLFEYWSDILPAQLGTNAGLRFRCNNELLALRDYSVLRFDASGGLATTKVGYGRYVAGVLQGAMQWSAPWNEPNLLTVGLRLGMWVNGTTILAYTEPIGGGARTDRATFTATTADADGAHQQFGLNRTSNTEIGTTWDNLRLRSLIFSGGVLCQVTATASLAGVLAPGDTFTVTGETATPLHTYTGPLTALASNYLASLTFTPAMASDAPLDTPLVFTDNRLADLTRWDLETGHEFLDATAMSAAWREWNGDIADWGGVAECWLDYGETEQAALIDAIAAATPVTTSFTMVFEVAPQKLWYGNALCGQFAVVGEREGAFKVRFTFHGDGSLLPQWNT